jgi:hypothetical protein
MKTTHGTFTPAILKMAAAALAALPLLASSAHAQDGDPPGRVARIAWLSGNVSLQPAGTQDWGIAPPNYPMTSGDRLYVDQGGRAIIQNGSTDVRVWGGSDVTLTNLTDDYEQIGIAQGSVRVRVFAMVPGNIIEVDTPSGAVIVQQPGDYRVNVYPGDQGSVVEVNAGSVQIAAPNVNQYVDQGEAVQLYGTDNVEIGLIDMMPFDDLDHWSIDRDHHIMYSASARYVSRDIPGYDDLDDYGGWTPTPDYGPVWFPNQVAVGWQPYTVGHWAYVAPWGYTWVDDAPWGYAPFHYGRWVTVGGRWGWVPGPVNVRPVYAPAFVAFVGGGPGISIGVSIGGGGGGVAAWFPLGVAEPFVPWYHCSPSYVRTVNVTNVNVTVIHNTTIVNNYNVFINNTRNVTNVNQINVTNVTYVNRTHVVAVNQNAMTSGARVQQAVVHLNPQQQQQLVRAPIVVSRPPVAAPARPMLVQARASVSRPAARPVLMTPHGRAAATPVANRQRFTPASLPKPAPATAIRPATHPVAPNLHPAAPAGHPAPAANNNARPGTPAANKPSAPANTARPNAPATPENRPGQPGNAARPAAPAAKPHPAAPEAARPAAPANNARPATPAARPAPQPENKRPAAPATTRPAVPETAHPARPEAAHPAQPARPETKPATPAQHPAPQTRPGQPAPANRPGVKPEQQKKAPPPKKEEKPKEEQPPQ